MTENKIAGTIFEALIPNNNKTGVNIVPYPIPRDESKYSHIKARPIIKAIINILNSVIIIFILS